MNKRMDDVRAGREAISPSDVIPDPFLDGLTRLSRKWGIWIEGGQLSEGIDYGPDRIYRCEGFDVRRAGND